MEANFSAQSVRTALKQFSQWFRTRLGALVTVKGVNSMRRWGGIPITGVAALLYLIQGWFGFGVVAVVLVLVTAWSLMLIQMSVCVRYQEWARKLRQQFNVAGLTQDELERILTSHKRIANVEHTPRFLDALNRMASLAGFGLFFAAIVRSFR